MFIYARPHEFFKELQDYNFLYIFLFLSLVGIAHDISEKRTRLMMTPMHKWVFALAGWCVVSLAIRRPDLVTTRAVGIVVSLVLFLVIAMGAQRISGLMKILGTIFFLGVFVAYVGADQGLSPFQCVMYAPGTRNGKAYPDGRECEMKEPDGSPHDGTVDCIATGKPGNTYQCERAGLFGTTSVGGGRVRYLGVLQDPNELALATAFVVPFAFAFLEIRTTIFRLALLLVTLAVVGLEVVFTGSRGGQVTLGAVLGAYFVKKYGIMRGAIVGAVLVVPVIMLGGRSSDEADASTLERLGCSCAGIKMLTFYPFTGVGYSNFTEHHHLTAHNAYILAAGELGAPGMFFFAFVLFLAIKIPLSIMRFPMVDNQDARTLRAIAMAILAIFVGAVIGIFFLSWTYHYVLWIHFGLVASLYTVMKRLYPTFEVKLTWKEARAVMAGYIAFLLVWTHYIKSKGAWD
ncbi:Putative membrane protein of ExoQ family, involved in exopolysaccharide production [Minicystis rosea]|nr:Putative membrane protein of ExoQ family, involved in exopolysaccharide production [Minicystis rosea]